MQAFTATAKLHKPV